MGLRHGIRRRRRRGTSGLRRGLRHGDRRYRLRRGWLGRGWQRDRLRHIARWRVGRCRGRRRRLSRGRFGRRRLSRRRCRRRRRRRRHRLWCGSRSRSGCRSRSGHRGQHRGRRGSRRRSRRKERERVEIPLLVRRRPDAEVDVRLRKLGVSGRSNRANDLTLGNRRATRHGRRAKMRERHGVTVARHHRDHQAALWDSANEMHRAGSRSVHALARSSADVDAPVLSTCVRVRSEVEGSEHCPARRPRPCVGSCWKSKGDQHQSTHNRPAHRATLLRPADTVVFIDNVRRVESSEGLGCRQM